MGGFVVQFGPTPNTTPNRGYEYFDQSRIVDNDNRTFRPHVIRTGPLPRSTLWDGFGVSMDQITDSPMKQGVRVPSKDEIKQQLMDFLLSKVVPGPNIPLTLGSDAGNNPPGNAADPPGGDPPPAYRPPEGGGGGNEVAVAGGGENIFARILRGGAQYATTAVQLFNGAFGERNMRGFVNYLVDNYGLQAGQALARGMLVATGFGPAALAINDAFFAAIPRVRYFLDLVNRAPLDAIHYAQQQLQQHLPNYTGGAAGIVQGQQTMEAGDVETAGGLLNPTVASDTRLPVNAPDTSNPPTLEEFGETGVNLPASVDPGISWNSVDDIVAGFEALTIGNRPGGGTVSANPNAVGAINSIVTGNPGGAATGLFDLYQDSLNNVNTVGTSGGTSTIQPATQQGFGNWLGQTILGVLGGYAILTGGSGGLQAIANAAANAGSLPFRF